MSSIENNNSDYIPSSPVLNITPLPPLIAVYHSDLSEWVGGSAPSLAPDEVRTFVRKVGVMFHHLLEVTTRTQRELDQVSSLFIVCCILLIWL